MSVDVAVVGGGPAGAVTAGLLARAGRAVVLVERVPAWRWRACGVFTSPATVAALRGIGLPEARLAEVARPIPAMRVETLGGSSFRMTYGGRGALADSAVGLDRSRLDPLLLAWALEGGAEVRMGVSARRLEHSNGRAGTPRHVTVSTAGDGATPGIKARVAVGADGLRSLVAQAAGVVRRVPLGPRVALTFHVPDPAGDRAHDARMVVIRDGYVGLAPVPGARINVGIVLGRSWFAALRESGATGVARRVVGSLQPEDAGPLEFEVLDHVAGVSPLGVRLSRRAGDDWLVVGDAAGFLDPFTGEGLHRSIASARLAAEVVDSALAAQGRDGLGRFDRMMRARFGRKDLVSRIVQAFLERPVAFEYAARRLATRERPRELLGRVIGDLEPAERALDPRYLFALLRP